MWIDELTCGHCICGKDWVMRLWLKAPCIVNKIICFVTSPVVHIQYVESLYICRVEYESFNVDLKMITVYLTTKTSIWCGMLFSFFSFFFLSCFLRGQSKLFDRFLLWKFRPQKSPMFIRSTLQELASPSDSLEKKKKVWSPPLILLIKWRHSGLHTVR